jgi:hypothetical protein
VKQKICKFTEIFKKFVNLLVWQIHCNIYNSRLTLSIYCSGVKCKLCEFVYSLDQSLQNFIIYLVFSLQEIQNDTNFNQRDMRNKHHENVCTCIVFTEEFVNVDKKSFKHSHWKSAITRYNWIRTVSIDQSHCRVRKVATNGCDQTLAVDNCAFPTQKREAGRPISQKTPGINNWH